MSQNSDEDEDVVPEPVPAAVCPARKWTRNDEEIKLPPDDSVAISRPGPTLREVFETTPPPSCDLLTCATVREWLPTLLNGNGSIKPPPFHKCPNGCGLVFCDDCLDCHESWCKFTAMVPRSKSPEPRGGYGATFHRLVESPPLSPPSESVDERRARWREIETRRPLRATWAQPATSASSIHMMSNWQLGRSANWEEVDKRFPHETRNTCARTHAHTHARTHAHTHAHTHTRAHAHTRTRARRVCCPPPHLTST